jgi:poly(A) polymerase
MKALLADVPQSRLFDEMLKLLQTGHARASIEQLRALGLDRGIYPLLDVIVAGADEPFLQLALQDTDRRVQEGKPVAPSFLLASVLWADVLRAWDQARQRGLHPMPALHAAIDEVFDARIGDVSGRGKLGVDMREIWTMQPRFDRRSGQSVFTLVEQPRFRAGFDFLRLRAATGEVEEELAHWWEAFSVADDERRRDMVQALQRPRSTRQAAKPARPPSEPALDDPRFREAPEGGEPLAGESGDLADAPARKRRRRRRRSGGGEGAEGGSGGAPGHE